MRISKFTTVALIVLLLFNSCGLLNKQKECELVACTKMFSTINVQLTYSDGTAFIADSTQTIFNNDLLHTSYGESFPGSGGFYTVANDSHTKTYFKATGNNTLFKVYKNGNIVAQTTFSITADCCHISKLGGLDVLVVN